jgi:hypothetical protein
MSLVVASTRILAHLLSTVAGCCCYLLLLSLLLGLQAHGFAFGKSDLFFCCGCRPVGSLDTLKTCVSPGSLGQTGVPAATGM